MLVDTKRINPVFDPTGGRAFKYTETFHELCRTHGTKKTFQLQNRCRYYYKYIKRIFHEKHRKKSRIEQISRYEL